MSPPSMLVVSHNGGRTGAPMVLLHLVREWVRAGADVTVLVLTDGPMVAEFAGTGAKTLLLPPLLHWEAQHRRLHGLRYPGLSAARRAWLRRHVPTADIGYFNTTSCGPIFDELHGRLRRRVTHVHELAHWLRHRVQSDHLASALSAELVVACGDAVAHALHDEFGVPRERLLTQPECVPLPIPRRVQDDVRRQLGLRPDAFIVGGVGTTDHRKGVDLFGMVLAQLVSKHPQLDVQGVWLGHQNDLALLEWVRRDAELAGVGDRLQFVPPVDDPASVMQLFDVFALTSREDPYPLVMVEAAALGIPTVAFADSGGAEEFLANGRGRLVPYGDVSRFAEAVAELLALPAAERHATAQAAQRSAVDEHAPAAAAARLLSALAEL